MSCLRRNLEAGFSALELVLLFGVVALPIVLVLTGYRNEIVRTLRGEVAEWAGSPSAWTTRSATPACP